MAKTTNAQKQWKAMRFLKVFTNKDIIRITGNHHQTVKDYSRLLCKGGFIRHENTKSTGEKVYRVIKPDLVQAPSWVELGKTTKERMYKTRDHDAFFSPNPHKDKINRYSQHTTNKNN